MKRIFIGDISDTILDVLAFTFEKRNFEVKTFKKTGELDNLLEYAQPDMLILNTELEDIQGIELVLKIKELSLTSPVLMMSTSHNFELKLKARKSGIEGWILKPFIAERLAEAIENYFFTKQ